MRTASLPTVCACFSSHQMSEPGGFLKCTSLNRSPVLATRYHYGGEGQAGVTCARRSWPAGVQSLYDEVQCIMGIGHMGHPCGLHDNQTDTTENITFPQLPWRTVTKLVTLSSPTYHVHHVPRFQFPKLFRTNEMLISYVMKHINTLLL